MRTSNESGATSVIVAIMLLVFVGFAALAIDLGSVWSVKRDFAGGADAAALAASRDVYYDVCLPGGTPSAGDYAAADGVAASVFDQNVTPNPGFAPAPAEDPAVCGKYTVSYLGPAQTTFAGIFGFSELRAYAETTVQPGDFLGGGLRPLAVCMSDASLVSSGLGPGEDLYDLEAGDVLTIDIDNEFSTNGTNVPCNPGAGNFGWTCFDRATPTAQSGCGGGNGASALAGMVDDGYGGEVNLDGPGANDDYTCGSTAPGSDCEQNPGGKTSLKDNFVTLMNEGTIFSILGIDRYSCDPNCNGSNATTQPVAFISVQVTGVDFTGNPKTLELTVQNLFREGTTAVVTGGRVERIPPSVCDVEDNFSDFSAC